MTVSFQEVSPVCGAEVHGFDPRILPNDETKDVLRRAFFKYRFLLIRGYQLSEDEEVALTEILGPTDSQGDTMKHGRKVMFISNAHKDGVLPDGEIFFHSDHTFFEFPLKAIALHALVVPSQGGETLYANTAMAYANLPERLKRRIAGLTARHGHDYSINRGDVRAKGSTGAEGPRWVHPVVRNHPQTGEPLLFVSRLITEEIIGLPPAEGDELLEELLTYIEDPKVIYRHKWRVGDYIAWDNLALQHARTNFDPAEKRVLRRVPISGRDVAVAPASH